ncbi:hypothetical protein [Ruegeria sp. HKCCA4008]|nr:hypothetical protein [Ruegeria sp. HKCCA4008]
MTLCPSSVSIRTPWPRVAIAVGAISLMQAGIRLSMHMELTVPSAG